MAGGILTFMYISLAARLIKGILPGLQEAAKKTASPADDIAVGILSTAVEILSDGSIATLLNKER